MTYDIAVIGGGIVGRAIAHALAIRGWTTACVYARADLNRSATAAAGAMLSTVSEVYLSEEPHTREVALKGRMEGRALYDDWADSLGLDPTGVRRTQGVFVVASSASRTDRDGLNLIRETALKHRIPVETVSPREIPAFAPEPGGEAVDALYIRDEGALDSGALLAHLESAILRSPNAALTDSAAVSVQADGDVVSISTTNDLVEAKQAVIATGAFYSALLQDSGLGGIGAPEIFSGRGVSVLLETRFDMPQVIRTPNRSFACGVHAVPRCSGLVYLGATNRFSIAPSLTTGATAGELNSLLTQGAQQINSGIRTADIRSISVGHRPLTVDHLPVVGRSRSPRLLVASGTYRNGVVMAPLIARLIAEELESPGRHADHVFSPDRFISSNYTGDRRQWIAHSAKVIVESLLEIQTSSQRQFENGVYAFVHTALSALSGDEQSVAPLREKAERFLARTPLEEALPSLVDMFARSAGPKARTAAILPTAE